MNRYVLLLLSVTIVLSINLRRGRKYDFSYKRAILISFFEVILGIVGTQILYFVENMEWGGTSFYGAVLLLPVLFIPVSYFLDISFNQLMDYLAPSGLAMYVVNKLNCYMSGCCGGKIMEYSLDGIPLRFPSQIFEMVVAIFIVLILLLLEQRANFQHKIYPLGLIIYGGSRFILNIFREEWVTTDMIMPFGNIWSLVAIIIGFAWLYWISKKNRKHR